MTYSLLSLPNEILVILMENLELVDLCTLACVCKQLKDIAETDAIWKKLYHKKYLVLHSNRYVNKLQEQFCVHFNAAGPFWKNVFRLQTLRYRKLKERNAKVNHKSSQIRQIPPSTFPLCSHCLSERKPNRLEFSCVHCLQQHLCDACVKPVVEEKTNRQKKWSFLDLLYKNANGLSPVYTCHFCLWLDSLPQTVAILKKGIVLHQSQRFEEAVDYFTIGVLLNQNTASALNWRSSSLAELGNLEGAISDLNESIALEKESLYYANRAFYRAILGKIEDALSDANLAIVLNPRNANHYIIRCFIYNQLKQFQDSLRDANSAIRLSPSDCTAYRHRAYAKLYLNDFNGALDDLGEALKIEPDYPEVKEFPKKQEKIFLWLK